MTEDPIYSNFDHILDESVVTLARANPGNRFDHPAWEFHAEIWFEDGLWHEEVRRHHCVVGNYTNTDLKALIAEVNERHGHD